MAIKILNNKSTSESKSSGLLSINNKKKQTVEKTVEANTEIIKTSTITNTIKEGDRVRHKEENLTGKVTHVGSKVSVLWDDKTRERIKIEDVFEELDLEYVDDVESLVSPMTTQRSQNDSADIASITEKAIENFEDSEEVPEIDIEKVAMQRQLDKLNKTNNDNTKSDLKEKIANDLVDIMVMKGMIDEDDRFVEAQRIISMNDEEYASYQNEVLEYDDSHSVSSRVQIEDPTMTEGERMLARIKGSGGGGIIGDFETQTTKTAAPSGDKRSLGDIDYSGVTFENVNNIKPTSLEDSFESLLNKSFNTTEKVASKPKRMEETSLKGFENIQGLKKPLNMNTKTAETSFPTNTTIKELFSDLDWTTTSKIH